MPRVPGSINSKNNARVNLIKKWDGKRSDIKLFIGSFCAHLADLRLRKRKESTLNFSCSNSNDNPYTINWIEQLLQTPIADHRKFIVWMILPQYFINVRKLSYEQSCITIQKWLDMCNELKGWIVLIQNKN
jgi:hypothetical protein